jgi:hypothetical protein
MSINCKNLRQLRLTNSKHGFPVQRQSMYVRNLRFDGVLTILRGVDHADSKKEN